MVFSSSNFITGFLLFSFLFSSIFVFAETNKIPYQDSDFKCLSAAEADKYIKDFNIRTESFGGLELCNADVDTKKLFNDIKIVEGGKFTSGENLLTKGFVDGSRYYSWLKSQTYGINRGNDIPWATAYNSGGVFHYAGRVG